MDDKKYKQKFFVGMKKRHFSTPVGRFIVKSGKIKSEDYILIYQKNGNFVWSEVEPDEIGEDIEELGVCICRWIRRGLEQVTIDYGIKNPCVFSAFEELNKLPKLHFFETY